VGEEFADYAGPSRGTNMVLTRLLYVWRWLRAPLVRQLHVTLYEREGCHLCETARKRLDAARRRWGFALTTTDVDSDAALREQFGECVPVVTVNGKVRFRGEVNAVLLERLLRAESTPSV
jgi:glutaredoxin